MDCQKIEDERLQGDKVDVLYGEADAAARARLQAHLAVCAACRQEMTGLSRLRADLTRWQLPRRQPAGRGIFLPRWLAVAAALVAGLSLSLGAAGILSVRRALALQEARTEALLAGERQARAALERALAAPGVASGDALPASLLARVDARVDERLRASEERQAQLFDARLARLDARLEAQRRVDLARVAEGLSYLDGQHGQQLARTNELMGYVLSQAAQKR
ncbi:MAG TPA: zf-HC2 domain-containing protein [Vicinamibacteria bacterium]|nr:zf-HC2 domain-containing protein [Vicinamibacteria bacterium]